MLDRRSLGRKFIELLAAPLSGDLAESFEGFLGDAGELPRFLHHSQPRSLQVLPEARRGLGLSLLRSGQVTDGKAALAQYLQLKPDAADAKAIQALLAN